LDLFCFRWRKILGYAREILNRVSRSRFPRRRIVQRCGFKSIDEAVFFVFVRRGLVTVIVLLIFGWWSRSLAKNL
jgi:hypothetical protein